MKTCMGLVLISVDTFKKKQKDSGHQSEFSHFAQPESQTSREERFVAQQGAQNRNDPEPLKRNPALTLMRHFKSALYFIGYQHFTAEPCNLVLLHVDS